MKWNMFKRRRSQPDSVPARLRPRPRFVPYLERLENRIAPALGTFEIDANATTQTAHD